MIKHLITIFLALALMGCNTQPQDPPINSIKPIDSAVMVTVRMNLKTDAELAASTIEVKAENDLLVLQGVVPSEEAKKRAEEIAKKSKGVEKVANHLEVQKQE